MTTNDPTPVVTTVTPPSPFVPPSGWTPVAADTYFAGVQSQFLLGVESNYKAINAQILADYVGACSVWTKLNTQLKAQQDPKYPTTKPTVPKFWQLKFMTEAATPAQVAANTVGIGFQQTWVTQTQDGPDAGSVVDDIANPPTNVDIGAFEFSYGGFSYYASPATDNSPVGHIVTVQPGQTFAHNGAIPAGTVLQKITVYMGQMWISPPQYPSAN